MKHNEIKLKNNLSEILIKLPNCLGLTKISFLQLILILSSNVSDIRAENVSPADHKTSLDFFLV